MKIIFVLAIILMLCSCSNLNYSGNTVSKTEPYRYGFAGYDVLHWCYAWPPLEDNLSKGAMHAFPSGRAYVWPDDWDSQGAEMLSRYPEMEDIILDCIQNNKQPFPRAQLIRFLGRHGSNKTRIMIIDSFIYEYPRSSMSALGAMAGRGMDCSAAVNQISNIAKDKSASYLNRRESLYALGRIRTAEAVQTLVDISKTNDKEVQKTANYVLETYIYSNPKVP